MDVKHLLLLGVVSTILCYIGAQDGLPSAYYSSPGIGKFFGISDNLAGTFTYGFGIGLFVGSLTCKCKNQDQGRKFCSFLFYEMRIENVEDCIKCVIISDQHTCKNTRGCEYLSAHQTEASAVCVPSGCAQLMDFDTKRKKK